MNIHPLTFRPDMMRALLSGAKTETRRLVSANNSRVLPGTFQAAELGTARIRTSRHGTLTEIRATCELPSGRRVTTIGPKVQPGDVFWTRKPRGRRADSLMALVVEEVHARRLQDMTDKDALAEGIELATIAPGGTPRARYAMLWDEINGRGSWEQNDWVWVYRFSQVRRGQVDALYGLPVHKDRKPASRGKAH